MKFTVEVEEFWLDDENLEEGLANAVKNDVLRQIKESTRKQIDVQVSSAIRKQIEDGYQRFITKEVKKAMKKETIKSSDYGTNEISIEAYIRQQLTVSTSNAVLSREIQKISKIFVDEMKDRVDLMFASQIVSKMNESGLLKDDVAKILLTQ